jgi:hypothetical protein
MEFRQFLENRDEYQKDISKMLSKIPKSHQDLVKDYQFIFQPHNVLKRDEDHIGEVDEENKKITVCAPWNYSRNLTTLHEIAHLVWKYLVSENKKKEWNKIAKNTKMEKKDRQIPEELFCMAYGATYSNRPPEVYLHKQWQDFIKKI